MSDIPKNFKEFQNKVKNMTEKEKVFTYFNLVNSYGFPSDMREHLLFLDKHLDDLGYTEKDGYGVRNKKDETFYVKFSL